MLLYQDHESVVYSLAFSPDGSALASGAKNGTVFVRDSVGERYRLKPDPNNLPIYSVAYTPDGTGVLIGGASGWRGQRFDGHIWNDFGPSNTTPVTALALLNDHLLAVGVGDRVAKSAGKFELWDMVTGEKRPAQFFEPNGVRGLAVCPGKRLVAWTTGHRKVCVWDSMKARPIDFPQPKECPAIALSPDGKLMAAAVDYSVRVYGIEKRQQRVELKGHKGQVSAVAFSPDGETIATGSWDETVKLWDAATGRERTTFRWPIGRVTCLAYAPDGLRLAAGGDLGKIVVWDME
ncbi:MAG: WD40 repeat domain-containing protein [Planctomycetes bacterium]|nr:WD40 repeat domain-containing protein [Planctomycetota bacterium]